MNYIFTNIKPVYNIILTCFIFLGFGINSANADQLKFYPGATASYIVSQKLDGEIALLGDKSHSQVDATIEFDVKILSIDPDSLSYPYEVEFVMKRILISETDLDHTKPKTIKYDSSSSSVPPSAISLAKLINYPLHYKVKDNFQIVETTGYLETVIENDDMDSDSDSDSDIDLINSMPFTIQFILTQMFHLSGEDLISNHSYSFDCSQIWNLDEEEEDWEDDESSEYILNQTSAYVVNEISSDKITATWQAKAERAALDGDSSGEAIVNVNVTWDVNNALIQNRTIEATVEETSEWIGGHVKFTVQQSWKAFPSKG